MKTLDNKKAVSTKTVEALIKETLSSTSNVTKITQSELSFTTLLNRLTILKDENYTLLRFEAKDHYLLEAKESNKRATTNAYKQHQNNIIESVGYCGVTSAIVVTIEDNKFYVAEGMNRTTAFKKEGLTIIAFVSKANFSDTFTMMNLNVKPLKYTELLQHCSIEGDYQLHYQTLIDITAKHIAIAKGKKNIIQKALIHGLLSGLTRQKSSKLITSKKFKTTPKLIAHTEKTIQQIYDLQIVGNICTNRHNDLARINESFIALFNELGEDYNHATMLKNLKKADNVIYSSTVNVNINKLRDIHNNTTNGMPNK